MAKGNADHPSADVCMDEISTAEGRDHQNNVWYARRVSWVDHCNRKALMARSHSKKQPRQHRDAPTQSADSLQTLNQLLLEGLSRRKQTTCMFTWSISEAQRQASNKKACPGCNTEPCLSQPYAHALAI